MNKILNSDILKIIARIMVGLVFLIFGLEKIPVPNVFAGEIMNYGFFPLFSVNLIAIFLPWVEVLVGIFVLLGIRLQSAATFSGILMILFIISVGIAMAKGLDISCGCSSSHNIKVGWQKIFENLGYLILCIYIFIFPNSKFSLDYIYGKFTENRKANN